MMTHTLTCKHYAYCDYRILEGGCPKNCDTFCHVKNKPGTPYARGLENTLNVSEISYRNGQEAAKDVIIEKLMEISVSANGADHSLVTEIIEMVRRVEIDTCLHTLNCLIRLYGSLPTNGP